jgi:hypothetical protein
MQRMYRCKREKLTADWIQLHEGFHSLSFLPKWWLNQDGMVRCSGDLARTVEMKSAGTIHCRCEICREEIIKYRWEGNIKIGVKETEWEDDNKILAQDRVRWRALVLFRNAGNHHKTTRRHNSECHNGHKSFCFLLSPHIVAEISANDS